jgi:CBS domain-containing protein
VKVRWAYRPEAAAVTPSNTLREAAAKMRTSGQSCLPVIDGSRVIGIVTERDIVDAVARGVRTAGAWVFDYTHDGCTSIALDDDCETVALKMLAIGCRHLPVVDRGRLIGMVSMRDVILKPARLARPARRPAGRFEQNGYLSSRPPSTTTSSPVM